MTGEETIKILKEYQKTHPETAHYVVGPDLSKRLTDEKCAEVIKKIKTRFPNIEKNMIIYNEIINAEN
jgi:hypothetical protein